MAINPAAVVKSRHTSSSRKISSTFKRPRSHQFKRIKASWRRPVGIDSKDRRGFKGTAPKPKCGYRSSKATRGANSHGFHEILVSKVDDLNLVWFNKTFSAVIRHGVSSKNRKLIVEEAKKKGIRVENSKARMISQPNAVQAEEAKS